MAGKGKKAATSANLPISKATSAKTTKRSIAPAKTQKRSIAPKATAAAAAAPEAYVPSTAVEISPTTSLLYIINGEDPNNNPVFNGNESLPRIKVPIATPNSITKAEIIDNATGLTPGVIAGIPEKITIVKTRRLAADTLLKSLQQNEFTKESTDLLSLMHVFSGAIEDEGEQEGGSKEGVQLGGAPLKRATMNDDNGYMLNLDKKMCEIITTLYSIFKSGGPKVDNAGNVLRDFMVVSSAKEYLDTGQLYAIVDKVVTKNTENTDNGWDNVSIMSRALSVLGPTSEAATSPAIPTSFPVKPMLESIDGAACEIAANSFFTSYCNVTLKAKVDKNDISQDSSFYIDNADVFLLSILMSDDSFVDRIIFKELKKTDYNDFRKIITDIREGFKIIYNQIILSNKQLSEDQEYPSIDLLYYSLKTEKVKSFLENVRQSISFESKVLLIPKKMYYFASVASFLYKQNAAGAEAMKADLISCNFDPMCHDNGHSEIYRCIMALMMILKNDTTTLKNQMIEMSYLKAADGSLTEIVDLSKSGKIEPYINNLVKELKGKAGKKTAETAILQNVFLALTTHSADNFENRLYTRLRDKCCYVFPVMSGSCSDFMAIVTAKNSAHFAFIPTKEELTIQQELRNQSIFPISSLHHGVMIPEFTYCAIDAPLKHSLSLSTVNIKEGTFKVIVTAVTEVDAAAQVKKFSEIYGDPIKIIIPVANLSEDFRQFTYEFVYGPVILKKPDKKSGCPEPFLADCPYYNNLVYDFEMSEFYTGAGKDVEYTNKAPELCSELLKYIAKKSDPAISDPAISDPAISDPAISDPAIRDAFSKLISIIICPVDSDGFTIVCNKPNQSRATAEKRKKAQTEFITWFKKYMGSGASDKSKWYVYLFLKILMNIIERTRKPLSDSEIQNNFSFITSRINSIEDYIPETDVIPSGGMSGGVGTGEGEEGEGEGEEGEGEGKMDINTYNTSSNFDTDEYDETDYTDQYNDYSTNEISQLSYNSMFGKYGFDMVINNETHEFELVPIDTLTDYVKYLQKYGLLTMEVITKIENFNSIINSSVTEIDGINKDKLDRFLRNNAVMEDDIKNLLTYTQTEPFLSYIENLKAAQALNIDSYVEKIEEDSVDIGQGAPAAAAPAAEMNVDMGQEAALAATREGEGASGVAADQGAEMNVDEATAQDMPTTSHTIDPLDKTAPTPLSTKGTKRVREKLNKDAFNQFLKKYKVTGSNGGRSKKNKNNNKKRRYTKGRRVNNGRKTKRRNKVLKMIKNTRKRV